MEGELYVRLGYTMDALYRSITRHLAYSLGVVNRPRPAKAGHLPWPYPIRSGTACLKKCSRQTKGTKHSGAKRLYYLSMEFLIGRSLANNLRAMKIYDQVAEALQLLGTDVETICDQERDAALGNGGLGRLAACFLDSMASLDMPGFGYGLHYDYGLFEQDISNGYQREKPDSWISEAPALAGGACGRFAVHRCPCTAGSRRPRTNGAATIPFGWAGTWLRACPTTSPSPAIRRVDGEPP